MTPKHEANIRSLQRWDLEGHVLAVADLLQEVERLRGPHAASWCVVEGSPPVAPVPPAGRVARIAELCHHVKGLIDDPHSGLATWMSLISRYAVELRDLLAEQLTPPAPDERAEEEIAARADEYYRVEPYLGRDFVFGPGLPFKGSGYIQDVWAAGQGEGAPSRARGHGDRLMLDGSDHDSVAERE